MATRRVGLWLIGAFGSIGSTVALGLASLKRGLASPVGMVTTLSEFQKLPLAHFEEIELGGHDLRPDDFTKILTDTHAAAGLYSLAQINACKEDLVSWQSNIRPGVLLPCEERIRTQGQDNWIQLVSSPLQAIQKIGEDLRDFKQKKQLDQIVVVNVSSTETQFPAQNCHARLADLNQALAKGEAVLPASSLYAYAALDAGFAYVNFTPSLGASIPALAELAEVRKTVHAGQDAKTGETLLKTVLAPMFAARHFKVLSWVGHNILGGGDGYVLDDPRNKQPKMQSKEHSVSSILGYKPQTHVSIEYIESMQNWKTAWDHIHFEGFLGTKMTMQFTWQGCDAMLAAPLVMDLARLSLYAQSKGEVGILKHLACFFKSPIGVTEHDFFQQFEMLKDHLGV
ncbi:inositol-3-phosphate synthase [Telmatocola sphagniphila]|uniref:Inositol-3-phosphate synthase n=1 Tax=Telmatocola sphagniphila TaxID=1123043 RepID=A0A8E6BAA2_9BACT|nr:inositol-3-phosphate synthase [Telmatocola sphagniphila]QVL34651.1 inositol-3-phosphate synthase [Telmatocola sphagniphila]